MTLTNITGDAARWRFENSEFAADWRGFLFIRGHVAGADSVARLCRELRTNGPELAFARARGSFALTLLEKSNRNVFRCSDAFGLVQLFAASDSVHDNLIELVRRLPRDETALDRAGLASFLRYGFYALGRTIDRRVRLLAGDEIAVQRPDFTPKILRKSSRAARENVFDFESHIADLKTAVSGECISLDLTGGIDSRVIAAAFTQAHIPVAEAATMGTGVQKDLPIAQEVAAKLSLPHMPAHYSEENFEARIPELLSVTNGQTALATYDHAFQFARERLSRGITLAVSGAGGELWKDFWWLQDFPFLSGKPRLNWLYATRMEPRPPDTSIFTSAFAETFDTARRDYVAAMTRFAALPKIRAYDSVYAFLRVPYVSGPWVSATARLGLPTLCPLLDSDGVSAAMQMRRRERLFAAWHRKTISRLAPQIAGVRTAEGISTRAGAAALLDAPFYVADKSARLAQKVAQRAGLRDVRNRALFDERAFRSDAVHAMTREALATLARFGVTRPEVQPENLSFPQFDRVLTAGLLLREIS